jgi:cell filamentation protein
MSDNDDPYLYPGTDVLKNTFGIKDAPALKTVEYELTRLRMREELPKVPLTVEGYRALHKHIFQDVYPWAGTIRTVNLAKGESVFAPPRFLGSEMDKCFESVRKDERLLSRDLDEFAKASAEHINEINARHPFREGNGRTQRALLEILADRAGHHLAIDRLDPQRWNAASITGFREADHEPMQNVLKHALSEEVDRARESKDHQPPKPDNEIGSRRKALREELRTRRQQERDDRGR